MGLSSTSIKSRVMLAILLTSLVVLALTSAGFIAYELLVSRQELERNLRLAAQIIADQATASLIFESEKDANEVLSSLRYVDNIQRAALYDDSGSLFAYYPTNAPLSSFPHSPPHEQKRFTATTLLWTEPVIQEGKHVGTLFLESDLGLLRSRLRLYFIIGGCVTTLSLGVALLLSNILQRSISQPILELANTARVISDRQDYSVRARQSTEDEVGLLTRAFNYMLTQIQDRESALRESAERLGLALQAGQIRTDEIKRLNGELEQRVQDRTAALTEANGELEAFTYTVSHDLRAPLRHIDAFAKIIDEELANPNHADLRGYVNRIRRGTQTMGRLVDDLLNLSRVGRSQLGWQDFDLNALVQEVMSELHDVGPRREIEWRISKLPNAKCDAGLMKQVFANLLSNAVKYTRPRSTACIEVGLTNVNGEPAIYVRDNGVGFNMKYVHKLFGVFERLHRPEEFEGTGIGLATVRRIIQKHGGRVWAESEPDKGATFFFTLPGLSTLDSQPGAHSEAQL